MINEYENLIRSIILDFLGEDSSNYKISQLRINRWEEKKEVEITKNNGICLEPRLIYYSDFYDLETIIDKNWEVFKPLFIDKKRFTVFFKEMENYRNTVSHGRNLTKSQLQLLEGIYLDQNNQRVIYRNKNEMKDDFFIRIIRVSDNLGNVWPGVPASRQPVIRVGDNYELLVESIDPKGRNIEYEIEDILNRFKLTQEHNRFNFKVENNLVGQFVTLFIYARTPDSEYRNLDSTSINLTVLP